MIFALSQKLEKFAIKTKNCTKGHKVTLVSRKCHTNRLKNIGKKSHKDSFNRNFREY